MNILLVEKERKNCTNILLFEKGSKIIIHLLEFLSLKSTQPEFFSKFFSLQCNFQWTFLCNFLCNFFINSMFSQK